MGGGGGNGGGTLGTLAKVAVGTYLAGKVIGGIASAFSNSFDGGCGGSWDRRRRRIADTPDHELSPAERVIARYHRQLAEKAELRRKRQLEIQNEIRSRKMGKTRVS